MVLMPSWKTVMLETGIDRLLALVSSKGKIPAKDAAKQLSVPLDTIESWADILEKENMMSKEYTPGGALILSNTSKNTEEKRRKINDLKEDISIDVGEIDRNIREKEKAIDSEHKKIEEYEKILLRESGESEKIGAELKSITIAEEKLRHAFKVLADEERRISKDTRSIRSIIKSRASAAKKLESQLKKFEDEKNRIYADVKLLEKLSASIKDVPADKMYEKIQEVERKTKEVKEENKRIGDRYSVVMDLLDKIK